MSDQPVQEQPYEPAYFTNVVQFKCECVGDYRRFQDVCKAVREEFEALGPLLVRQRILQMELADIEIKIKEIRQ